MCYLLSLIVKLEDVFVSLVTFSRIVVVFEDIVAFPYSRNVENHFVDDSKSFNYKL